MVKYTRKQINQQTDRFRKSEFVLYEDVITALQTIAEKAIECGASEEELIKYFDSIN